ncbi:1-acyl-sn-glycerol-3-phosphate acyltransferase [Azorhizobium oxalatiphilum]|uniref:1-acyl-sn-glycerol-3-phosphate acyltransferase n=1 Tax=Azorhizobium oxalatiphilum TaxID=980631 RepID=A0A917BVJ4_9HYPH|nr:lysophospholipid acyltransferase family protein [Azorhizobium oxalatiphilum]GGF59095.1 1-acyl-sn-glycerol-3-phosphate acyltransferase [Azorhizobium oxalatiphilum]
MTSRPWFERLCGQLFTGFARLVTGARSIWQGCAPEPELRVYFANHASHGDFVLLWAALPTGMRETTRPVAGADYWRKDGIRRFIGEKVFNAVLIERNGTDRSVDPIEVMADALDAGSSLIIFPEGTRNTTDAVLLPFKSGIFRLAQRRPQVDFVPVWIDNLNRVMPKGEIIPLPLLCTLTFGTPLRLGAEEGKTEFLDRARDALLALKPMVN